MGNIMRYGLLWAATGIAAGILAFSEFSLSWGILAVLYGLCWGILLAAWRLKQVTAVVCICADTPDRICPHGTGTESMGKAGSLPFRE